MSVYRRALYKCTKEIVQEEQVDSWESAKDITGAQADGERIEEAKEAAEAAVKAKSEFLACDEP